jgi:hypothetical protein
VVRVERAVLAARLGAAAGAVLVAKPAAAAASRVPAVAVAEAVRAGCFVSLFDRRYRR